MVGLPRRPTVRSSLGFILAFTSATIALTAHGNRSLSALRADALKGHVYFLCQTAQDTWDRINYPKIETITRLVYQSARHVADGAPRPRFVAGPTAPAVSSR
jgi:hypothetical protein